MRCGCILVVIAIALLAFGVQGLHDAYAYRKPVVISSDAFLKSVPQAGWYHIKDCVIDVTEAVYMTNSTGSTSEAGSKDSDPAITKLYLPVHSPQELDSESGQDKPVSLLVETTDESTIETVKEIHRLDAGKPEDAKKWLKAHLDQWLLHRDVNGMVKAGINSDSSTRDEIAKVHGSLSSNYVILEEGTKPSMRASIGMVFGGIGIGLVAVLFWVSKLSGSARKRA